MHSICSSIISQEFVCKYNSSCIPCITSFELFLDPIIMVEGQRNREIPAPNLLNVQSSRINYLFKGPQKVFDRFITFLTRKWDIRPRRELKLGYVILSQPQTNFLLDRSDYRRNKFTRESEQLCTIFSHFFERQVCLFFFTSHYMFLI